MKKYNSLLNVSFSINHNDKNGEDITLETIREAFDHRFKLMCNQELFEASTGCFENGSDYLNDTTEN